MTMWRFPGQRQRKRVAVTTDTSEQAALEPLPAMQSAAVVWP
jgi:hypothetical protein